MRTLILLLALSACLSVASVACAECAECAVPGTPAASGASDIPVAQQGTLDLSASGLADSGPIDLRGSWHFYWGEFVRPGETADRDPLLILAPAQWGSQPLDIGNDGYGTYRLDILLHEDDAGRTLGLYIPSVASAYDLYINGEKKASAGQIGVSAANMKPAALPQMLYIVPQGQELELVVHVSNYSQRKGGMWSKLRLGTAEQMTKEHESSLLFQTFLASGLLIIGIYHVGLHVVRVSRSAFYFGLACLALCLRTAFVGEMLAMRAVPNIPWELAVKIEYMSVLLGFAFLLLYFYHLYENNTNRIASHGLALLSVAVSAPILVLPAKVYTDWMVYYEVILLAQALYMLYGLIRAAVFRRTGALMNLTAGLIFVATVLNDIIYYTFQFETVDLVMLGLFIFIITQMFMLSRKFASAFNEAERLKTELEGMNDNLEMIVFERTEALQQTNEQLAKSEKARKDVLSHVTHELGNPLTSVIGYLRRLKDGVPENMQTRHIEIAYEKSLKLEHLMDDLRQLVKLEHGQLVFDVKTVKLDELYNELQSVYDWELLDREFRFDLRVPEQGSYTVEADLNRLEQVYTNFINNAIAHTKPTDVITITGRCFPFAGACIIQIQDEGEGIPKDEQARIFDRFYRVNNAADKYEGSGLGLTISKAIVEAHRGKIGVRGEYGQGSTFYFILPCREVQR